MFIKWLEKREREREEGEKGRGRDGRREKDKNIKLNYLLKYLYFLKLGYLLIISDFLQLLFLHFSVYLNLTFYIRCIFLFS